MNGPELRKRRLRAGCSRNDVAHAVGVPVTTVGEWEDGVTPITCPSAVEQVLRQYEARDTRDNLELPAGGAHRAPRHVA